MPRTDSQDWNYTVLSSDGAHARVAVTKDIQSDRTKFHLLNLISKNVESPFPRKIHGEESSCLKS